MRSISVVVAANGGVTVTNGTTPVSYSGEHNATRISVTFTDLDNSVFGGADYFRIVFNGSYSERITVSGDGFVYDVPQSVTVPPSVRCQISGYRESGGETVFIAKSAVFCFDVEVSEPGEYEVNPDPGLFFRAAARCEEAAGTANSAAVSAAESLTSANAARTAAEGYALAASSSAVSAEQSAAEASESASAALESAAAAASAAETVTDWANTIRGHKSGTVIFADDIAGSNGGSGLSAALTARGTVETTVINGEDIYGENVRTFAPAEELYVTVNSPFGSQNKGIKVYAGAGSDVSEWTAVEISYSVEETGVVCTAHFTVEDGMLLYEYELCYTGYDETESFSGSRELPEGAAIIGVCGADDAASGGNTVTARTVSHGYTPQTVTVTGRNLAPFYRAEQLNVYSDGDFSVTLENGNIVLDGTLRVAVSAGSDCFKTALPLNLPAGTYFLSYCGERLPSGLSSVSVIKNAGGVSEKAAEAYISADSDHAAFCQFSIADGVEYHLGLDLDGSADSPLTFCGAVMKITVEKSFSGIYRPALPTVTIGVSENGPVLGVPSYYPEMTAFISGGTLDFDYKVDTDIAFKRLAAAITALGGVIPG